MPNAGRLNFNEVDLSFSVAAILSGIVAVALKTKRGPVNDPSQVMRSLDQYRRVFGGQLANDDPTMLVERIFDYGAQARVNRIAHYTTIGDKTSLTATKSRIVNPNAIAALVFSGPMVAGNILELDVDGVTVTCTVFAVDHNTTLGVCAGEIVAGAAAATAAGVAATEGGNNLILLIKKTGAGIVIDNISVTGGASQPTVTLNDGGNVVATTDADGLFALVPKYPGADYDGTVATIANASNGNANYFDLTITLDGITESYTNLTITGVPTQTASDYLKNVANNSNIVDVVYYDLSGLVAPLRPLNGAYTFTAGSDGGALVTTDFSGDAAAKTGIRALDGYDDFMVFGVIDKDTMDEATIKLIADYADVRKDSVFFADLHYVAGEETAEEADITASRDTTAIDSNYTALFAGGIKVLDPLTSAQRYVSPIADILGLSARSDSTAGEHFSFAGINRGKLIGALGVSPNFGSAANYNSRNALANKQINVVVNEDGRIYLTGNFTAQLANSKLSWLNIRKDLIHTKKSIGPTLKTFLEEPADLVTFRRIHSTLEPFFEKKVTDRAWSSYRWEGDQDVDRIENVVVNNTADLDNGKYKAKLFIKEINSINEIEVSVVVTATSVDFNIVQA